jgi:hypothetical protein
MAGFLAAAPPAQAQLPLLDDFTDAPASYGSANHGLISGAIPIWMGDIVLGFDPDFTDQPSAGAVDDDCNTVEGGLIPIPVSCLPAPLDIVNELLTDAGNFILDDEDGVNIGPLVPGQVTAVSVEATTEGFLDAWIDWAGNGQFTDAGDQVFNNQPLAAGPNALSFTVPNLTTAGLTYSRFRFGSTAVPGPTGAHPDGEVEDYGVVINQDFGDAPDNQNVDTDFPTTLAEGGARHRIGALKLGNITDGEADGITSPNALGDDANPVGGPDDEDGITFGGPLVQGGPQSVTIRSTGAGEIDAWADWNDDQDWSDAGEQIFDDHAVNPGNNVRNINVPATATVGSITTRWRLSVNGVATFGGLGDEGEVEDHEVAVASTGGGGVLDFGDAPSTAPDDYPTLLVDNGARHAIGTLALGNEIDAEADGQPSALANGDDINPPLGPDDEDGINFTDTTLVPGKTTTIEVESTGTGFLDGWVDANHDGDWEDEGEHVVDSEIVTACGDPDNQNPPQCTGVQEVPLQMPPGNTFGDTYARFRLSSGGTNAPEGFVPDGEVEDYLLNVVLECGATVIGQFELPFDLNCPGNGPDENGLFIGDHNTEIDLNGHTISGDGVDVDRGISLAPGVVRANDVFIHDGSIVDFGGGIEITGERTVLTNLNVDRNHGNGIEIEGIDTHLDNVNATNNVGDGLHNAGHGLVITDSSLSQNDGDGVQQDGNEMVIEDSSTVENGGNGVLGSGADARIENVDVSRNGGNGVDWSGQNMLVTASTIDDNVGHGLSLVSDRARVHQNPSVSDNGADGIRVNGHRADIAGNTVLSNGADGIHIVGGARRIFVFNNTSKSNGDDGIDYEKPNEGRVVNNLMGGSNGNRAIEAWSGVHGNKNKGRPCRPTKLCR